MPHEPKLSLWNIPNNTFCWHPACLLVNKTYLFWQCLLQTTIVWFREKRLKMFLRKNDKTKWRIKLLLTLCSTGGCWGWWTCACNCLCQSRWPRNTTRLHLLLTHASLPNSQIQWYVPNNNEPNIISTAVHRNIRRQTCMVLLKASTASLSRHRYWMSRGGFKVEGLLGHDQEASDKVLVCSMLQPQPHPNIFRSTSANHNQVE